MPYNSLARINSLRAWQDGRHFPDVIFKDVLFNEIVKGSINDSLKFVPKGPFDNIPAMVQIMAWRHHITQKLPKFLVQQDQREMIMSKTIKVGNNEYKILLQIIDYKMHIFSAYLLLVFILKF